MPAVLVTLLVGAVAAGSVSLSSAFRHEEGLPDALDLAVTETTTTLPTRSSLAPARISTTTETAPTTQVRAAAPTATTTTRAKLIAPLTTRSTRPPASRSAPQPPPPAPPAPSPSPSSSSSTPRSTSPTTSPTTLQSSQPQRVVEIVNVERGKVGCRPLTADQRLIRAAQAHSEDMSANNYFSHTSLDGRTFADRIRAAGYPNPAAENIAKGQRSAEQVMQAWMNSSGHRANILNCGLTTIGVGLDTDGWYWTQDFGR